MIQNTIFVATRFLLQLEGFRLKNYQACLFSGPGLPAGCNVYGFRTTPARKPNSRRLVVSTYSVGPGVYGLSGICRIIRPGQVFTVLPNGGAEQNLKQVVRYGSEENCLIEICRADVKADAARLMAGAIAPEQFDHIPLRAKLTVTTRTTNAKISIELPTEDACRAIQEVSNGGGTEFLKAQDALSIRTEVLDLFGLHVLARSASESGQPSFSHQLINTAQDFNP